MLERKRMIMTEKKLYRIYRTKGLSVRRRRGRKRAHGGRTPMPVLLRPNQRWPLDVLSDTSGDRRKFRILAVNDDGCRENRARIAPRPARLPSPKPTTFTPKDFRHERGITGGGRSGQMHLPSARFHMPLSARNRPPNEGSGWTYGADQSLTLQPISLVFVQFFEKSGADEGTRTPDPRITNALLYQLSYIGTAVLITSRAGLS